MGKLVPLVQPTECDPFMDSLEQVSLHLGRRFGYSPDRACTVAVWIRHLRREYRRAFHDCWHGRICEHTISVRGHIFYVPDILKQYENFIDAFMAMEESVGSRNPYIRRSGKW